VTIAVEETLMLAQVTSFATIGLDGAAIQVEVDISRAPGVAAADHRVFM
jgi:hypothetical protein